MDAVAAQPTGDGQGLPNFSGPQKSVLDILLAANKISKDVYDKVKLEAVTTGKLPETILGEKQLVEEELLVEAKAQLLNVPYVKPSEVGASQRYDCLFWFGARPAFRYQQGKAGRT